ncbi:MAG: hypothetical protein U5J83_09735 [Bryobacterales bacterium]|nr:hypothetical protein [Bryobacterales bacterium]
MVGVYPSSRAERFFKVLDAFSQAIEMDQHARQMKVRHTRVGHVLHGLFEHRFRFLQATLRLQDVAHVGLRFAVVRIDRQRPFEGDLRGFTRRSSNESTPWL